MIQDLEAVVDESGKIRLLTEIHLKESRRALVTILDEAPKEAKASQKENLRAVFARMRGRRDVSGRGKCEPAAKESARRVGINPF